MESDNVKRRLKGWEKRFIRLAEDELAKPFDWGNANCGHLIGTAITACHGPEHPALKHLVGLANQDDVSRLLYEFGGLSKLLELHFERNPTPLMAMQADIGVYMGKIYDPHSSSYVSAEAGCIILDGVAVGKAEGTDRPVRVPIRDLKATFKV